MLAVAILIVLIATLICFYKGLKDKNYAKAKILGMIYIFLNYILCSFIMSFSKDNPDDT